MATYNELFRAAFTRTLEWDLGCPGVETFPLLPAGALLVPPPVERAKVRPFADDFPDPVHVRIGDCCGVHHKAVMIAAATKSATMPLLTLGEVHVNGKPRYGLTRQHMRQLLREGAGEAGTSNFNFHVWLTFPDLTILDLVLRGSLEYHSGRGIAAQREDNYIVFGTNEQLGPELDYAPYLVGEEVLYRIGSIWDEDAEMLRRLRAS